MALKFDWTQIEDEEKFRVALLVFLQGIDTDLESNTKALKEISGSLVKLQIRTAVISAVIAIGLSLLFKINLADIPKVGAVVPATLIVVRLLPTRWFG